MPEMKTAEVTQTKLPAQPTLAELQTFIAALVARRGWTTDANEIFTLFTEEVGEVAKEIRRTWKDGVDPHRAALGAELADVLFYVADLANVHGIDLAAAVADKAAFNETRADFGA